MPEFAPGSICPDRALTDLALDGYVLYYPQLRGDRQGLPTAYLDRAHCAPSSNSVFMARKCYAHLHVAG